MVAKLLNYLLKQRSSKAIIAVDTSGDTGPAAIAGVKGLSNIDIFCLYPHGRVSSVQELQMITVQESNVHVYRTEGDSDEQCAVLKEIFSDEEFSKEHNLISINSINWARIAVQSSYYVWAYLQARNIFYTYLHESICMFLLTIYMYLYRYISMIFCVHIIHIYIHCIMFTDTRK